MPSYIGYRPQFEPISLQEYLAVPTTIIGEYAKAEDKFEEYQDKAEQLAAMVGEDPYGRKIIDNYRNQLQGATSAISDGSIQNAEGLRQALGARKYYRENLMPLEVGIPYWEQYKKAKLALGEDPLEDPLTLESFVRNPAQAYSLTKGSDVRNLAANMAKAASARRIKDPEYMGKVLGNNYYRTKSEAGFSDQEIQDWINGAPNPELDEIRDEVQKQYGNISPEKLNRFINEGVYLGAIYDKKFEDKAIPKVTTSGSGTGTGTGDGSNVINWKDYWRKAWNNQDLRTRDINVYNPSNATNKNGNLIGTILPEGNVILKNPINIVGSLRRTATTNDAFGQAAELRNIVQNLTNENLRNKLSKELEKTALGFDRSKYKNQQDFMNASVNTGIHNQVAKEVIKELFLKKNSDGTYSLDYTTNPDGSLNTNSYKKKLSASILSGSRKYFEDIINQINNAGIDNTVTFKDVNDFLAKLENAYNGSEEFRNKGMTTAIVLPIDDSEGYRILNKIQGSWMTMGDITFKNGVLQTNPKPLDDATKVEILNHLKDGTASQDYPQAVLVNSENGPQNFYRVRIEDRSGKKIKHYNLMFTPEQYNGYATNSDQLLNYNELIKTKQIYESGSPMMLQRIGSNNRMSFRDYEDRVKAAQDNANAALRLGDRKSYQKWIKQKQQLEAEERMAYMNASLEGVLSDLENMTEDFNQLQLDRSTVIGKRNINTKN